ncbi:hypothetical protein TSUD_145210 [Trifolium subterraneum]|uniref:Uncharacterized protein n=1 Tax=Trifolium subterraneum TaxID=3900 RepID=A0A2Z6N077_TRISU|nr:hypothetical protein TSUD_145210 [Trifolium subterraneum]
MEIFKFFFYFINLLFAFILTSSSSLAIDPYSQALLSLKSELIDDDNSLHDWVVASSSGSSYPCCSWSGIKCNKDSIVISIDLSMKKLGGILSGNQLSIFTNVTDFNISYNFFSGKLPPEIFNLTSLKSLDINRNNFSGQFPKGIPKLKNLVVLDAFSNSFSGQLPAEFSELEYLKILNLAGSYFSGTIPSEYGSFRSLEFLHLAGNSLSGTIPRELGNLKTLTHMEIGYNLYHGFIPPQLGNLSQLHYLDIAGANLSGTIPKEFSNLTSLQSLFLFRNQLTGSIPSEFSNIKPLTNLDLSDNFLSGSIPESFSELKSLRLLSLMYNDMSGTVPDGIAELRSLETLLIWNNHFSGLLPKSLGKNSKLKWVDVSTNKFNGSIPPDICRGGVLSKLIMFSNRFTGSLFSISNCSSLVRLRLEDNSFSGEVTLKFSHLPDITYVDLSCNIFVGGIPLDISQATQLEYFNVSYNKQLGGIIPTLIWSLPQLRNFSASSCGILGILPSFDSCKSISTIDLGRNNLYGTISKTVSKCQALVTIELPYNNMTGQIPEELARLLIIFLVLAFGILHFRKGFKSQWKMVSFVGLPQFTANDVLTSFSVVAAEHTHVPSPSSVVTKAVLPTEYNEVMTEELSNDVYNFGKMILEILTGRKLTASAATNIHGNSQEVLLREVYNGHETTSVGSTMQEIKLVFEVAMLCTKSRSSDRPFMEDVLKLLSGLKCLENDESSK